MFLGEIYVLKNKILLQPPLDGTDTIIKWTSGTNKTENGEFTSHGSYLAEGWENNGLWQLDFDYKYTSTYYIGTMFITGEGISPFTDAKRNTYTMTNWEGSFPPAFDGQYISSPSSWTKPSQTIYNHVTIIKTSENTFKIILNDIYEWEAIWNVMPNFDRFYIGSRDNPASRDVGGNIVYKNIIVKSL